MRNKKDITIYKNYWSWIIIGSMLLAFIFIFLFLGEINLSKLNWLVATNGKKYGELSDKTLGFGINTGAPIVNGFIFLIMVGVLLIAIAITLLLIFINKIKFSSLSFIISTWFIFFTIVTTGLLYSKKGEFQWPIIIRILLVIASYPITFFPFNYIVKKIFINTKYGEEYIADLISNEKENAKYISYINKSTFKKKKNEETTIEIEKDKI